MVFNIPAEPEMQSPATPLVADALESPAVPDGIDQPSDRGVGETPAASPVPSPEVVWRPTEEVLPVELAPSPCEHLTCHEADLHWSGVLETTHHFLYR